jgi:hypothetical protein
MHTSANAVFGRPRAAKNSWKTLPWGGKIYPLAPLRSLEGEPRPFGFVNGLKLKNHAISA